MGGMTRLLLLLWAGVTTSTVVDLQKRISGGQNCGPTERLYHVEVRRYDIDEGFTFCGGSLINKRWILTAAHCWDSSRIMRAVLGIHPGGQGTVEEITPYFFFDDQNWPHDIMLLKLTNPTKIKPVPLPVCGNRLNVGTVEMAGRAATAGNATVYRQPGRSDTLRCAHTTVANCGELPPNRYLQHVFCGQKDVVDACLGDFGGGVVFHDMIYGVISYTCDPDHVSTTPAGFMMVCAYMDWIVKTTSIARPKSKPAPGPGRGCQNCFDPSGVH